MADAPAQPRQQALRLQRYTTRYYTIHTNLSRNDAVLVGRHMDAVFDEARKQFSVFGQVEQTRMDLYLFHEQGEYESFIASHNMSATNTGGMFFVQRDIQGLAAWTGEKPRSQVFAVLQHEGFHQFAWDFIGPGLPIWANEGLAQLFEDAVLVRKRLVVGLRNSMRIARVKHALESGQALGFDAMLNLTQRQWQETIAGDAQRSALLYDQAWSMAYFLTMTEPYRGRFTRYLEQIKAGQDAKAAFTEAFGNDTAAMGGAWRTFVLNVEPDAINLAVARLEFFGQGLRLLHQRREKMPTSFDALQRRLERIQFRLEVHSHGSVTRYAAEDEENFTVELPNGRRGRFNLLPPVRGDLPPRISAQGLNPIPTLIWSKNEEGELVQDIEYR